MFTCTVSRGHRASPGEANFQGQNSNTKASVGLRQRQHAGTPPNLGMIRYKKLSYYFKKPTEVLVDRPIVLYFVFSVIFTRTVHGKRTWDIIQEKI